MTGWRKPARIEALAPVPTRKSRPVPANDRYETRQASIVALHPPVSLARQKRVSKCLININESSGAPRRNRTADPIITNDVLYQLSYRGMARVLGERPRRRKRP